MATSDRVPPHDEDAEKSLLGCILVSAEASFMVLDEMGVTAEAFYLPVNRAIYELLDDMRRRNRPIDLFTAPIEARTKGILEAIGGDAYLEHLVDRVPTATQAEYFAEVVLDKALRRQIIERSRAAVEDAYYSPKPASEVVALAQSNLSGLIVTDRKELTIAETAGECVKRWRNLKPEDLVVRWPLRDIHDAFGHIEHELIILASQPSIGKTAFVLQTLLSNARRDVMVSLLSLESPLDSIAARCISLLAGVNTFRLRRGLGPEHHLTKADEAAAVLAKLPFRATSVQMTLEQIRAWAMREKAAGSRLLAVDNTRHIRSNRQYKNRFDLFADISIGLKHIRDDVGLPIIVLHHTNNDGDLSWSSDFKRDADIILKLECDVALEDAGETPIISLLTVKAREGKTGTAQMRFDKAIQTFFSVTTEDAQ